jgi:hypothetical protein
MLEKGALAAFTTGIIELLQDHIRNILEIV